MIEGQRVIRLVKALKYLPFFVSRNTYAGIYNIKLKHLLLSAVTDINAAFGGKLKGILDQVCQYLG